MLHISSLPEPLPAPPGRGGTAAAHATLRRAPPVTPNPTKHPRVTPAPGTNPSADTNPGYLCLKVKFWGRGASGERLSEHFQRQGFSGLCWRERAWGEHAGAGVLLLISAWRGGSGGAPPSPNRPPSSSTAASPAGTATFLRSQLTGSFSPLPPNRRALALSL